MSLPGSDRILVLTLRGTAFLAGVIVVLIVAFVGFESWPALRSISLRHFVADSTWLPSNDQYGLGALLLGTVLVSLGAVVLAAPLGVGAAIFAGFYAPPLVASGFRRVVELLAGIPSVVYGLWGLVVIVPLIGRLEPPGASLLAGIFILALMILPTIALLSESALRAVPESQIRAAAALGLGRWSTVRRVALPAARNGIGVAILLGTGRAIGETMAVLMVCGNVIGVPHSVFDPVRTLTANIVLEMGYATSVHRSALFVNGLALMALVGALAYVADRVGRKRHA